MSAIDVRIEQLLEEWTPRIGRPSCGPGCSRCCERMSVTVSSAEALRLLELVEAKNSDLLAKLDARIAALPAGAETPDNALDALLELGPCVFLSEDGRCGVYPARPDACRACHVWHPAEYCGREDYDMCSPAELNALRVDAIHAAMLAELDAGRRPFWGQLAPMVWILARRREDYLGGLDLSDRTPGGPTTKLIEFPMPGAGPEEIRRYLESERRELARVFTEEETPMGYPRASEASTRRYLAAFPLD